MISHVCLDGRWISRQSDFSAREFAGGSWTKRFLSMKRPDDRVLLADMLEHARHAVEATSGRSRGDLDHDVVLAAALERFVEVVGEAASKTSTDLRQRLP